MNAKIQRTSVPIVIGGIIFLLLALIGLDLYPVIAGNDGLVIGQRVDFQIATVVYLAGEVRDLAYRPAVRPQVISDMQVDLPIMKQVQEGLIKGDASLGLPAPTYDVKQILARAQPDYDQVYTAMKELLAESDSATADPIQVNIVLSHYRPYVATMAQLAQFLRDQAEATNQHLLIIKITLKSLLILVIGGHYILSGRKILDRLVEIETNQSNMPN